MKKVIILIPSYKREDILCETLWSLLVTLSRDTSENGYEVSIVVGLMPCTETGLSILKYFKGLIGVKYTAFPLNIGKAECLNTLFKMFVTDEDYVITMDNDMILKKPWLHLIDIGRKLPFNMIGFGSKTFWHHNPVMSACTVEVEPENSFGIYKPVNIAGGMLLFTKEFLEKQEWIHSQGLYGGEDVRMGTRAREFKYVIHWDEDWLVHDPQHCSTPELERYHKNKRYYIENGLQFPKEWGDEYL